MGEIASHINNHSISNINLFQGTMSTILISDNNREDQVRNKLSGRTTIHTRVNQDSTIMTTIHIITVMLNQQPRPIHFARQKNLVQTSMTVEEEGEEDTVAMVIGITIRAITITTGGWAAVSIIDQHHRRRQEDHSKWYGQR